MMSFQREFQENARAIRFDTREYYDQKSASRGGSRTALRIPLSGSVAYLLVFFSLLLISLPTITPDADA